MYNYLPPTSVNTLQITRYFALKFLRMVIWGAGAEAGRLLGPGFFFLERRSLAFFIFFAWYGPGFFFSQQDHGYKNKQKR